MIAACVVWLLAFIAHCGDQVINMYPAPGVGQPTTVVRVTPVKVRYNLVIQQWSIFPDLHDSFILETAQRVNIFYTVTINSYPQSESCRFWTIVKIDGKQITQLNDLNWCQLERTNKGSYKIWLEAGPHFVSVQYNTQCKITNAAPNGENWYQYGLLEIEYLKYSS